MEVTELIEIEPFIIYIQHVTWLILIWDKFISLSYRLYIFTKRYSTDFKR